MNNVKFGGFASYTAHLARALREQGYRPMIYKVGKKVEKQIRPFMHNQGYQNLSHDAAISVASMTPSLIVCAYWKQHSETIKQILRSGAAIVLHDPTEYADSLMSAIKQNNSRVVSIRKGNAQFLKEKGYKARFIQHPYVPIAGTRRMPTLRNAVTLSRLDWDKHTDIICQANELLPEKEKAHIYGAINRMYTHHKLDSVYPNWEKMYKGQFDLDPKTPIRLAQGSNWVIDMSVIKGDGGGSQYTFMESWDAGTPLIIHKDWLRTEADEMQPGVNCLAVSDGGELASLLRKNDPDLMVALSDGGKKALEWHGSESVVPEYVDYLGL